ncbi:hypothetical protein [Actinomadura madurae]|uniref:hypothetical protein n=1 Tax=Actinomadura madurae TaxID=1993 RepID=UPI00355849BC
MTISSSISGRRTAASRPPPGEPDVLVALLGLELPDGAERFAHQLDARIVDRLQRG